MVFSFNLEGQVQEVRFISVRTASIITGYNDQYLRRLLRMGKIEGIKLGQTWLIIFKSLADYLDKMWGREEQRCGPRKSERAIDS